MLIAHTKPIQDAGFALAKFFIRERPERGELATLPGTKRWLSAALAPRNAGQETGAKIRSRASAIFPPAPRRKLGGMIDRLSCRTALKAAGFSKVGILHALGRSCQAEETDSVLCPRV